MKKTFLALGLLAAVALVRPAAADAHVSFGLALPGFGLFVNAPPPPPVVYAPAPAFYPPPAYYYRPPVRYYAPAPVRFRHRWNGYRRYGW